jgi:hypothetical protein
LPPPAEVACDVLLPPALSVYACVCADDALLLSVEPA